MPLWVLAERRLKATRASSVAVAAAMLAPGRKAAGSKPLKASGLIAGRDGHGHDLAGQRDQQRPVALRGEAVGDRVIGERGGEQHRAIGQLAPEIAPDVRGQHRPVVELQQQAMQRPRPAA